MSALFSTYIWHMKTHTIAKLRAFRVPPRGGSAQHNEYGGRARRGIAVCSSCGNVYYRKEWHARSAAHGMLSRARREGGSVTRVLCPACSLVGSRLFEGEIILRNLPSTIEEEVLRLVRGFAKRALRRDPQHRIIAVEHLKNAWRITTTENQLAVRLAKKIRDTFNRVAIKISYSREPFEVGRVNVAFG